MWCRLSFVRPNLEQHRTLKESSERQPIMRDYRPHRPQSRATAPRCAPLSDIIRIIVRPASITISPLAPRSARASLILFAALRTLGTGARLNPSRVVSANLSHSSF